MTTDNYAIETAVRLNDIGFAEFTSDLIGKTFDAIVDANLKQTESFIDLVKEMTKSLSTYINDTKLEISNQEVLDYLGSLPPFVDDKGGQIQDQAVTGTDKPPVALVPDEVLKSDALNAINKTFTQGSLAATIVQAANSSGVTSLVKDSLGLVKKLFPNGNAAVFPLSDDAYYDPHAFEGLLTATNSTVPATVDIDDEAIAKLYDSVAEVIAGDKYALLQEMVKLGVMRLVVTDGLLRTSLTFSTYERYSASSSSYDKHVEKVNDKYKRRQAPSKGILKMVRNRPLEKSKSRQRDIHVQTASEQSASSHGTSVSIFGGVEIRFKTDYLPVARA